MFRVLAVIAVAFALLSGCGSSTPDEDTASSSDSSDPSPGPRSGSAQSGDETSSSGGPYFTDAESTAINAAARPAQAAAKRAVAPANERRCDRLGSSRGYTAWRRCWHGLLDPYAAKLGAVAQEFHTLQVGSFPPPCVDALEGAERTFSGFSGRVKTLLAGIDSPRRQAQTRSMRTYDQVVSGIENGYQKPFRAVTQACYSPEVLKKLESSPSGPANP